MARRATSFELPLPPRDPVLPAYRWLYEALRSAILTGRLRPGARLPSTRDLSAPTGLSRGTIVVAFEQLRAEGYTEGSIGSGTYVTRTLPDELLRAAAAAVETKPSALRSPRPVASDLGRRIGAFSVLENRPSRAFRPNLPALDLFPTTLWAQIAARRLRRASASLLLGCPPMGYRPLQEAVSGYLNASRGVRCEPGQIAIVSGVQEALDLTARLFVNPGDRVCVEDPGYPGAPLVFEAIGARIATAGVDDEGIRLDEVGLRGARLAYVTPAHQFPLGATMSLGRRLRLLEWARRGSALVFEDDYDSEFRYSGRPLPALQGFDEGGHVLFAGSFSKVLFPSLRLGYLVVPEDLVDTVAAARSVLSRHPPLIEQAVVCDFIVAGHFARHLRRMRQVYAERLSVLLDGARQHLSGLLEISTVEAGLQTVGWLRAGLDGESVARAAAARGVEVTPLGRYARGALAREGLQLGFAAVDATEIERGVRELAVTLERESKGAAATRPPRRRSPPGTGTPRRHGRRGGRRASGTSPSTGSGGNGARRRRRSPSAPPRKRGRGAGSGRGPGRAPR
jgi:GntR family transcriptional regulator/MocR family aminotransferase